MNILPLNTFKYQTPAFSAKRTKTEEIGPKKLEFTKPEKELNEFLVKLYRLESDIRVQKENLRHFYSYQDKYDYQELLKERQQLIAKLKRIGKKYNKDYLDMEHDVMVKKEYNRFAPKIIKANSIKELAELSELISSSMLFTATKNLLIQLIGKKKL